MTKATSSIAALVQTLLLCVLLAVATPAMAGKPDPLPSSNEGAAKRAIVAFVTETTTAGRPGFVPESRMHRRVRPGRHAVG